MSSILCLGEITVRGHMKEGLKKDEHSIRSLSEITIGGHMKEGSKKDEDSIRFLCEITVGGKMKEGMKKDQHVKAGVSGGGCKEGTMEEGKEKNKHVKAGEDGGASKHGKMDEGHKRDDHLAAAHDGKDTARMRVLQYLNKNWGGEWYLVFAIKTRREGAKAGEMRRDVGAKAGEPCRRGYAWCFAQHTTHKHVLH
jgi:hypothetical protein